jgi:hypothetical protein
MVDPLAVKSEYATLGRRVPKYFRVATADDSGAWILSFCGVRQLVFRSLCGMKFYFGIFKLACGY